MSETAYDLSKALPNKLLNADGSITDFQGNIIIPASKANAEVYEKTKAIVNKFITENDDIKTYAEISLDLFVVVDQLPEIGEKNKIYLVPNGDGTFTEYFYNENGKWDPIGSVSIDLSNYVTKNMLETELHTTLTLAKEYTDARLKVEIENTLGGEY